MKKERIQSFAARVTQASRSELTVILYEMVITELDEAKEAHSSGDMDSFVKELKKAQKYVNELMATLDYRHAMSYDLLSLYLFASKGIVTAIMKKDPKELIGVESIMNKLLVGFEGVSKEDKSGPMMRNTQQLYAGLTYGKGTLNETFIDPNSNSRGFIA